MHLSDLHRNLFLEYTGLEFGRINLNTALDEAGKDPTAVIAIQCPQSGWWAKDRNAGAFHSQLIKKALDNGNRDAWFAMRAYWVPSTGKLMIYQVETPGGHMVDPSEDLISRLASNLKIDRQIMSIDIIE